MEEKRKLLLIVNPCAGKDSERHSLEEIKACFPPQEYDLQVLLTEKAGDATDFVLRDASRFDAVVCAGGDGTLNEVITGVMQMPEPVKIGYLPCGSTNDFAATLGLPSELHAAAAIIRHGHTHFFDMGRLNNLCFSYVAAFGPGTAVSYRTSQKMKNRFGHAAYMLNGFVFSIIPTLKQVKPHHIHIRYDGGELEDDFYFGAVSNSLSVAGMFKYDPDDVRLNDGKMELLLVRKVHSPADLFSMFFKILRRDYDGEKLLYLKTSQAQFSFEKAEDWTVDGEYAGKLQTVNIRVEPGAVEIFSPETARLFQKKAQPQEESVS